MPPGYVREVGGMRVSPRRRARFPPAHTFPQDIVVHQAFPEPFHGLKLLLLIIVQYSTPPHVRNWACGGSINPCHP